MMTNLLSDSPSLSTHTHSLYLSYLLFRRLRRELKSYTHLIDSVGSNFEGNRFKTFHVSVQVSCASLSLHLCVGVGVCVDVGVGEWRRKSSCECMLVCGCVVEMEVLTPSQG